ncbi:MAG: hypothetical protein ACJAUR_001353 [Ulvibacter sp.]|jgi:hypothetical protein
MSECVNLVWSCDRFDSWKEILPLTYGYTIQQKK